jgi:hypothetical protein
MPPEKYDSLDPLGGPLDQQKRERAEPAPFALEAIGLEAEFELWVDGKKTTPERVFHDPTAFMAQPLLHRTGKSYALSTGGAVYFDTGVIEVATSAVEVEKACAARAGRSLWNAIHLVRSGLDGWERETGRDARLVGFSAHYNVSFRRPEGAPPETAERLAELLAYVLPVPMMLLAANRQSTGIGLRPRPGRVEVTADFTPSPALSIAAATFVVGVVRAVMSWPSLSLRELERRGFPVIEGYAPIPHTSRKGWLGHVTAYPQDPFTAGPDAAVFRLRPREGYGASPVSIRQIGAEVFSRFGPALRRIADPFTFRLLRLVFAGEAPILLDLPDRPDAYEDVGRACTWDDLFSENDLPRSRYERVLARAVAGRPFRLGGQELAPVGLRGWSEVVFADEAGRRRAIPVDHLLEHLDRWERER